MYRHRGTFHRELWSTFDLITNTAEDGCRVYRGGYMVAFAQGLMDSHDIKCTVNCTHLDLRRRRNTTPVDATITSPLDVARDCPSAP